MSIKWGWLGMLTYLVLVLTFMVLTGFVVGRTKGRQLLRTGDDGIHSRPIYHGQYVGIWMALPSLLLLLFWLLGQETVIESLLLSSMPEAVTASLSANEKALLLSEIKSVASGKIFREPSELVQEASERYLAWKGLAEKSMFIVVIALSLLGFGYARSRLSHEFRARQAVERVLDIIMIACSLIAIFTTLGIVISLVAEALRFFAKVPFTEFLFGLKWEPQIAMRADQVAGTGAFGAVPVFTGTFLIALIAMLVAAPVGLFSAIYLTEYASPKFRAITKPMLEILAGVPTVVYGFFAVLVIAPTIRDYGSAMGLVIAPNSALAAGLVMGIMIIPFVSSLSDDALAAVPQALRDGSYALGATKGETITDILLPAALPGIIGGLLLGVSRAIGETMIVVMAAGLIATMTLNPFEGVTTVTVQIVTLLTGDTEFDNPKTLAAFALGLVLFVVTLCLNIVALRIVQKYREKYD